MVEFGLCCSEKGPSIYRFKDARVVILSFQAGLLLHRPGDKHSRASRLPTRLQDHYRCTSDIVITIRGILNQTVVIPNYF